MANIKDVAKLSNVSVATVSRVLNGSDNVSPETRKRVLKAIKKLNYKPKPSFSNNILFKTIGVLVPDIRGYHYSDIVMAIESFAYEKGFDIMLAIPKNDPLNEKNILDQYFKRKVDGIILAEFYGDTTLIDKFINSGVPVVVMDFNVEEINFDVVNVDNEGGAYKAIEYLYKNGHRDIFVIRGPEDSPAAKERLKGVQKFMYKKSDINIIFSETAGYNPNDGSDAIYAHLAKNPLNFTAVFAVNDWTAIGAMDALKNSGYKIPDNVSIIGFDDSPFAEFVNPKLTTIRQPREEMGYTATEILIDRITNKRNRLPKNVVLPTTLIERNSVRRI
ncbi:LacI family DNA-binding transcriptional regulator [Marinitoga litoralis]|uniref:LacI family DNA-binding transcriptional regulator n=1 Tax=Marinitoga litoralis TaxID=570855 RepID=UPI001961869E|nr:LacI family DNA-binding transcriptional regulator [Marinitoga litoralis]MBM7559071.1 LacI family transcriptional regulator [Marinitoga litoralis]